VYTTAGCGLLQKERDVWVVQRRKMQAPHLILRRCQSVMVKTSSDSSPVRKRVRYVAMTSCWRVIT